MSCRILKEVQRSRPFPQRRYLAYVFIRFIRLENPPIRQLRIVLFAFRGIQEDNVLLRAPALTFYSIFSIIPAAALALGIAQGSAWKFM